jgi:uncharacterized protein (TIGR00299 family) protein
MKVLYYDCFSGISGDMNLGAMVDLGVDPQYLKKELRKLKVGSFSLEFKIEQRKGITGTRAYVHITEHQGTIKGHKELHDKKHHNDKHHNVHERNLEEIREIINNSSLNSTVKNRSLAIFQKIAEVEARIHGKSINEIHFHEVGAIDSIVDIVGAALCLEYLKPDRIISSSVEVGGGFVKCEHGVFPVPAPATAEILHNIPIKSGSVQSETTTPTGAAILATVVNEFNDNVHLTIRKTGYGIGSKDFDIPNVLRVHMGDLDNGTETDMEIQTANIIECNIDDMNPEMYGHIMDLLFENGADDVFITPIIMKKARPASKLSVLCSTKITDEIIGILIKHTTTLGVRKYMVEKMMLKREFQQIISRFGPVTIKTAFYKGKRLRTKPEFEDCVRIAKENNVPVQTVYHEINKIISSLISDAD